jgi:hypothetical protein
MKEFIVLCAALLIIILFPVQSLLDTAYNAREQVFDTTVRSYAERARIAGKFTPEILNDMRDELCDKLPGLSGGDIDFTGTTAQKYRGESASDDSMIDFRVTMPIRNRFVNGLIFGSILPGNTEVYACSGQVYSEATP